MKDAILKIIVRDPDEAEAAVEALEMGLGGQLDRHRTQAPRDLVQCFRHQAPAEPGRTACRRHHDPADSRGPFFGRREHAEVAAEHVIDQRQQMQRLLVLAVDIAEHTVLLDHEDVGPETQQCIELGGAQRLERPPSKLLAHAGRNSSAAPVAIKAGTNRAWPRRCSNSIWPKVRWSMVRSRSAEASVIMTIRGSTRSPSGSSNSGCSASRSQRLANRIVWRPTWSVTISSVRLTACGPNSRS